MLAGLMGGQYQSNNQAVMGPQGVNWGDGSNPADFFRADAAMRQPQGALPVPGQPQAPAPAVPPLMPASPPLPPPRPANLGGEPGFSGAQGDILSAGLVQAQMPPAPQYPSPVSISPHDVGQEPLVAMQGQPTQNTLAGLPRPPMPAPHFPGVAPAHNPFQMSSGGMSPLLEMLGYGRNRRA